MRDFLKLFALLFIPAVLLVLASTYVVDRNRLRAELDRKGPQALAERVVAASKGAPDLRSPDLGHRVATGSMSVLQQAQKELSENLAMLDKSVQRALASTLGFSPSGAELASGLIGWLTIGLLALLALFSAFGKYAPPSLRQRLITGSSGAGARSGGAFELPH